MRGFNTPADIAQTQMVIGILAIPVALGGAPFIGVGLGLTALNVGLEIWEVGGLPDAGFVIETVIGVIPGNRAFSTTFATYTAVADENILGDFIADTIVGALDLAGDALDGFLGIVLHETIYDPNIGSRPVSPVEKPVRWLQWEI